MLVQATTNRATRHIFQEAVEEIKIISFTATEALRKLNSHAQVVHSLFIAKVLHDVWMIEILQRLRFGF